MRNLIILFLLLFSLSPAYAADEHIIFLHHSTGGVIFDDGHVFDWFSAYNAAHNSSYSITERAYPTGTYPWENYPYDYWNLWVNGACRADEPSRHCLAQLAAEYDLVIFKNCYPVSTIEEDTGSPDITSSRKSLENYKLQYSAVRNALRQFPNTLFIFWTAAPLNESATFPEQAARARQFANWVKNDMLAGGNYPNIRVFDYFDLTANWNNVLRAEYERDSTDSHPNTQAAEDVGPVFAQFIVDNAQSFFDNKVICGNSMVEGTEECDDGVDNGKPCVPEEGQICTYCTSSCTLGKVGASKNFSFMYYLLLFTAHTVNE
jgi:hypothetical protein